MPERGEDLNIKKGDKSGEGVRIQAVLHPQYEEERVAIEYYERALDPDNKVKDRQIITDALVFRAFSGEVPHLFSHRDKVEQQLSRIEQGIKNIQDSQDNFFAMLKELKADPVTRQLLIDDLSNGQDDIDEKTMHNTRSVFDRVTQKSRGN